MKAFFNSRNGIFIVLLLLCFFSCSNKKNKAGYSEGHIVYTVDMQRYNSSVSYLCPESFDLLYSKKGFALKSSFMMGLMELRIFNDYSSDILNLLMGVSGNGQYTTYPLKKLTNNISNSKIKKISSDREVLGYKCKCLEYKDPLYKTEIRFYYSDLFDSKMSKKIFPELNIEGMILRIAVKNKNGEINIVAKNFSDEKIPTTLFNIPETYSKVSMDEIMSIIRDMSK